MGTINWSGAGRVHSKSYTCSYCNQSLASDEGYRGLSPTGSGLAVGLIYICHYCSSPTYFNSTNEQTPSPAFGNVVNHISVKEVESLYTEARNCLKVNAYIASVLCSRKLLMNVAVSKGAKEGLSFVEYVEFISKGGYVPPDGKDWVEHIRKKGNEATHEIKEMKREDAEELIMFLGMLLKFIYEFPAMMKLKKV